MDVSFIIVNYKSEQFLRRCIASIRQHAAEIASEIIIINNDIYPLVDFTDDPRIKIIEKNENLGFGKACNIGAAAAAGENLFFLNPDTEIQSSNITEIIQALTNPRVGIAAPQLITSTGNIEPWSVGNEITLYSVLKNNTFPPDNSPLKNSETYVDWVSGAALAISKSFFTQCDGFDENFFMYFEDVDLCKRARMLGKKIVILPQVKVLHHNGQSVTDKKLQKQQYYQSQDYYFQKHFGKLSAYLIKLLRETNLLFKK